MNTQWLMLGALACVLGVASAYDVRYRRVPNWLVVSTLVVAIVLNALPVGTASDSSDPVQGLGKALLGGLAGLGIMLPLYLLGAMGAGDAKLMAAVGAFLGPVQVTGAALLAFVCGGILSLLVALGAGRLKRVVTNLRMMVGLVLLHRNSGLSMRDLPTTGRLPYALAIASGTGLQIWLATQEGWPFK